MLGQMSVILLLLMSLLSLRIVSPEWNQRIHVYVYIMIQGLT